MIQAHAGEAMALLLIGVLLWTATPLAERFAGGLAASSALLGGAFVLVASALLPAVASQGGLAAEPASALSLALLVWGAVAYALFWSVPEPLAPPFEPPQRHCVPKLIFGARKAYHDRKRNLRTRLQVDFDVVPTNSRLHVRARAAGRAYYGLYFVRRALEVVPDVEIACVVAQNQACRAVANVLDVLERNESPLSVAVDHAIAASSDEVSIRVTMVGAVGASGGSIGASGFGFGGSIGLTGAAMSFKVPMGTFVWRCERSG